MVGKSLYYPQLVMRIVEKWLAKKNNGWDIYPYPSIERAALKMLKGVFPDSILGSFGQKHKGDKIVFRRVSPFTPEEGPHEEIGKTDIYQSNSGVWYAWDRCPGVGPCDHQRTFNIDEPRYFQRCLICDAKKREATKEEVAEYWKPAQNK